MAKMGRLGAQNLLALSELEGLSPAAAFVGEPILHHGGPKDAAYSTTFHGLEGHASDAELGVSAVEYAGDVAGLELMTDNEASEIISRLTR